MPDLRFVSCFTESVLNNLVGPSTLCLPGIRSELLFVHQSPGQIPPCLSEFFCPCLCDCTCASILTTRSTDITGSPTRWFNLAWGQSWVLTMPGRGQSSSGTPLPWSEAPHLEVGEVLLHEAVDLAHRQTACFAVLQGHGDQAAGGKR